MSGRGTHRAARDTGVSLCRPTLTDCGFRAWGQASLLKWWHQCLGQRHAYSRAVPDIGNSEVLCNWWPKHGLPEGDHGLMFQGAGLPQGGIMPVSKAQVSLLKLYADI